ncbi:GNAT family N-acetyltransferase [Mariniluteicoccus flavus]
MAYDSPLHTERLTLRHHRADDVDALFTYYGRPDVARFLLFEPWTREFAETQVNKRIRRTGLESESRALALVIEHDGEVIGDIALWIPEDTEGAATKAEIGWAMTPSASGHGYATEAARAVIEVGFSAYDLHRIAAQMDARNDASARLCERLGMTREAHLRRDWWSKGEWTDTLIFGLLAEDWRREASMAGA